MKKMKALNSAPSPQGEESDSENPKDFKNL
jgi:hypothetical protein